MQMTDAEPRNRDHFPSDHGRLHSQMNAHVARQWQPHWWRTRPAPTPNWLERLERGTPLPRLLRR
jgi:hypothetical protein